MTTPDATARLATFHLPDVGEGLTEAEILAWHVAVGDDVAVNQIIVEIETAKAAVELPSPYAGRVHALLASPGVTIAVGTPIIQIDTDPGAGPFPAGGDDSGAAAGSPESPGSPHSSGDVGPAGSSGDAAPSASSGGPATEAAAAPPAEEGAKIGETMADGRVATLVGYIPAAGGRTRRAKRGTGPEVPGVPAGTSGASVAPAASGASGVLGAEPPPVQTRAPLATPPVRKLAKDLGVDLRAVTASRSDGVISRVDVEAAHAGARATTARAGAPAGAQAAPSAEGGAAVPGATTGSSGTVISYDPATRETRVPVKGVRKMTAAAMVSSAFTAPHVTEFLTVDVTPMMRLRDRLRARPEFAEVRLSPLAFAARAVCLAARRTPEANSTWVDGAEGAGGEIVYKQYVHLGIAAATPRGLIVPVIRDADQLDLSGLAMALGELTATARAGRTAPADMTGGTFTITNVGVFGVDTGTPIINPGESAILALGSIKQAPWVVDGKLKVRQVCQLALSFDHRVIDGAQGSRFLADVGALLADPGLAMAF